MVLARSGWAKKEQMCYTFFGARRSNDTSCQPIGRQPFAASRRLATRGSLLVICLFRVGYYVRL
jgi:hypothetical protein